MDFLMCDPAVFVIENRYEISVLTKEEGIIYIEVDGKIYRPENSGVLSTNKNHCKVSIPQSVLNSVKEYTVCFKKCIVRQSYFSKLGEVQKQTFKFIPITPNKDLRIFHGADIHNSFEKEEICVNNFGNIDLFIFNGDIVECESKQDFLNSLIFLGKISKGQIPIVFSRGNHDTRGKYAEIYCDYFPCVNNCCYYKFSLPGINGVVLDLGEDKVDDGDEYGGVNDFHSYRVKECDFVNSLERENNDNWNIAVSHICPNCAFLDKNSIFNIENEIYQSWTEKLDEIAINFMLCGHLHDYYVFKEGDEENIFNHKYPVFTSSFYNSEVVGGAEIILKKEEMVITYRDCKGKIYGKYSLAKNGGKVKKLPY